MKNKTRSSSKDKTSQLFRRYMWLVDIVNRYGGITFEEINERWLKASLNEKREEYPPRTFHNHKEAIEQMFDIVIECDKRNGYKYFIDNTEDTQKGGVRNYLLNSFSVNQLIKESHKLKRRILFEQIPSGQHYLTPIIEAMRDDQTIELTYQSFIRKEPNTFEIEPYCLKVFRQRWYVVAKSTYKGSIFIYSLDRIKNLNITETKFKMPDSFDPETYFDNYFGILVDHTTEPCSVLLKVSGKQSHYLNSLPLHHSQEETETTDDYSVFRYFLTPTFDFKREILSYGDEIEVLTPDWFRLDMMESVKKMNEFYCGI